MFKQPHGGNVKAFSEAIGCKKEEVIDLSSNINFLQPTIDIDFNQLNIATYPNYDALQHSISQLYGVKEKEIELFNGATTAIYTLFRKLNLTHCTLYAPCYGEYQKAAQAANYQIEYINRLEHIEKEPKEGSLIIFVNPSTPDGKFYPIEELLKSWIAKRCTIFIDESFLEFTPYSSAINHLHNYQKLYILKSMTKFYSAAGIRIGAILSNRENIVALKQGEPIWKISEFDSHYLQAALRDKAFPKLSRELNQQHREELTKLLKSSTLIQEVYPSSANFLMIKLKEIDAERFQERLIPQKIMIRNCSNFSFLSRYFVRIAIKDKASIERLKVSLYETLIDT